MGNACFNCKRIEAVLQRGSVKKAFLEISQNLQENTFFHRTPLMAAFETTIAVLQVLSIMIILAKVAHFLISKDKITRSY